MINVLDFADYHIRNQTEFHLNFIDFDHLTYDLHTHRNFCEFFLITGGVIRQREITGTRDLRRGAAVMVPERSAHGFEVVEAYGDVGMVNLAFPRRFLRHIPSVDAAAWEQGKIKVFELLESDFDTLLADLTALSQDNSDWEFKLEHILYNFIYFTRYRGWASDRSIPPYLAAAYQKMHQIEHLHRGAARFFELCGCSPDHVCRLCKKYYQATPTELVNDLRIRHVAEKLLLTDEKIDELAYRVGYRSLGHFYQEFNRTYGETPRRYRMRHRQW